MAISCKIFVPEHQVQIDEPHTLHLPRVAVTAADQLCCYPWIIRQFVTTVTTSSGSPTGRGLNSAGLLHSGYTVATLSHLWITGCLSLSGRSYRSGQRIHMDDGGAPGRVLHQPNQSLKCQWTLFLCSGVFSGGVSEAGKASIGGGAGGVSSRLGNEILIELGNTCLDRDQCLTRP